MARSNNTTDERVLELKNQGLTNVKIAELTGVNISTVLNILSRHEGEYKHRGPGRHEKINLTDEQKAYIKSLKSQGYSLNTISEITGLSKSFIYKSTREEK